MTEQQRKWLQNMTEQLMEHIARQTADGIAERTAVARAWEGLMIPGRSPTDVEYSRLLSADPAAVARVIWAISREAA
jgi:hypothetical protein